MRRTAPSSLGNGLPMHATIGAPRLDETFAELDNACHKTCQRKMRSACRALLAFLNNHDEDERLDARDYARCMEVAPVRRAS